MLASGRHAVQFTESRGSGERLTVGHLAADIAESLVGLELVKLGLRLGRAVLEPLNLRGVVVEVGVERGVVACQRHKLGHELLVDAAHVDAGLAEVGLGRVSLDSVDTVAERGRDLLQAVLARGVALGHSIERRLVGDQRVELVNLLKLEAVEDLVVGSHGSGTGTGGSRVLLERVKHAVQHRDDHLAHLLLLGIAVGEGVVDLWVLRQVDKVLEHGQLVAPAFGRVVQCFGEQAEHLHLRQGTARSEDREENRGTHRVY
jgi:hypothetical protein